MRIPIVYEGVGTVEKLRSTIENRGLVAQGTERLRPKEGVGGSSPSEAAKFSPIDRGSMTIGQGRFAGCLTFFS